jgi:hypothetical protein
MKDCFEDRETKWDDRHVDNILWRAGITDLTVKVLATVKGGEGATTLDARRVERDETARQHSIGLGASQHAGAVQGSEPEECQLQHQPKPKPKPRLQLKPQSKQQHEPKPKPTTTLARMSETVQPDSQSQRSPTGPGTAPTSESSMIDRRLISRRDEGVPLPNMMDQEIVSMINKAHFHREAPAHF